jgi:hypothetical protein
MGGLEGPVKYHEVLPYPTTLCLVGDLLATREGVHGRMASGGHGLPKGSLGPRHALPFNLLLFGN